MGLPKITVPEYSLKLPSDGTEIKYRPFLVTEEKLLLIAMESENEKEIEIAIKNVIRSCIFGVVDVDEMSLFDVEYIFLWLRGKSKGEQIELHYNCPTCKNQIPVSFNIADVKIEKQDGHNKKIELTDSLGIVMKYPNMEMQTEIQQSPDLSDIDSLFETVRMCIDYIYDAEKMYSGKDHTKEEMSEFLESLTDEQFQKIAQFFETSPKLRHKIKLLCNTPTNTKGKKKSVCGYTEDIILEGLHSFFD